jgi:hypothetical protein
MLSPKIKSGSLKEIAKPYLGEYECKEIVWRDEEYSDRFDALTLELKPKGEFLLHYKEKDGNRRVEKGKYLYDEEEKILTLIGGFGGAFKREFPLVDGVLTVSVPIGGDLLVIKFEQK